jgi:hypothetical protein
MGREHWIRNDSLSSVRRVEGGGLAPTPGIILFEHVDFRGAHKHVVNRSEANLHTDGWGDRVSSMIVTSGSWRVCQHVNFGGWSFVLEPGIYPWVGDLGIVNEQISSIRLEPGSTPQLNSFETILYQHINFGGSHKHLVCRGETDLHADAWGDRVSSLQVLAGDRWQFFEHVRYSGRSIRRGPGSYRWIVDQGLPNDILSSVRANQIPISCRSSRTQPLIRRAISTGEPYLQSVSDRALGARAGDGEARRSARSRPAELLPRANADRRGERAVRCGAAALPA